MDASRLSAERLHRQLISRQPFARAVEVARWFGAIQAQDYAASLWALGLRTAGAGQRDVEAAVAAGDIVRMHGFRGTWQHVARDDARWMLGLVGARLLDGSARRLRAVGLAPRTLERALGCMARALAGGRQLTRQELAAALARAGIASDGGRLMHLLWYAELRGLLCSGAPRGKLQTFALFDERVPRARAIGRDTALARLAERYFRSRGPATERDLAWWSGLGVGQVREAIALARPRLKRLTVEGRDYWTSDDDAVGALPEAQLLPAFDECLIGYQDRAAFVAAAHVRRINAGGGLIKPILMLGGRAVGTWRRVVVDGAVAVKGGAVSPPDAARARRGGGGARSLRRVRRGVASGARGVARRRARPIANAAQPPESACRMKTRASGASASPSVARSRTGSSPTNTLTCRRSRPVSSTM